MQYLIYYSIIICSLVVFYLLICVIRDFFRLLDLLEYLILKEHDRT